MKDGGPAFPIFGFVGSLPDGTDEALHAGGMTLRDYFAAKAMQSMANGTWANYPDQEKIAREAYEQADAMLKARDVQSKD